MADKEAIRQELEKQKKRGKKAKIIVLIIVAALAAVYIAGVVFFSNHFYSRGSIFGIELFGKTVEEVKGEINDEVADYSLTVHTKDGDEVITAEQMGLAYADFNEVENTLAQQNKFLWFLAPATNARNTDVNVLYDAATLKQAISNLKCLQPENVTEPQNAYVQVVDGEPEVVPEVTGNELDFQKTADAISKAADNGDTEVDLEANDCYLKPEILSDDQSILDTVDYVNKVTNVVITIDFGTDRQEVINHDNLKDWISFDADNNFTVNRDLVYNYVYSLASKYDTFGLTHSFTTHAGDTIQLSGGDYGWAMDKNATTDKFVELIKAGEDTSTEPEYTYSAMSRDENDIGGSYVEVCISKQTMWCYVDGQCVVETPVVTGNPNKGNGTPTGGVWAIDARISPYTLVGQGYNSAVTYWLPFNGNVGIHDASWRSEYGGTIYQTNGSHGCVNTPYDAAQTIYGYAQIGWPVIVYD